jgi:hypothetical protein
VVDGDPDASVADVRGVCADQHRLVMPREVASVQCSHIDRHS